MRMTLNDGIFRSVKFSKAMSGAGYKTVLCLGLAGLLHAAYSAAEWRGAARMMEGDPILPLDIVLQTFIFLVVTMLGVIHIAGEFKEIRATVELENQSWENLKNRPSFYTWSHRGRVFSPCYDPPKRKTDILGIPDRFMS